MRVFKLLLLLVVGLMLASCATFKSWLARDNYTRHDQNLTPITVPDDLSSQGIHSRYPVQGTKYKPRVYTPVEHGEKTAAPEDLAPPGSMLERYQQKRMEKKYNNSPTIHGDELSLHEGFTDAWRKVGKALPRAGFQIMDDDNGLGAFYVVNTKTNGGKISANSPIYQVHLTGVKNKTVVTVLGSNNKPVNKQISQKILSSLQKELT